MNNIQRLKAEMLCRGVIAEGDINETLIGDDNFIHGTVFRFQSGEIVNTTVWRSIEDVRYLPSNKPPSLTRQSDHTFIIRGSDFESEVAILSLGEIGFRKVGGKTIQDWFSLHAPSTLFCSPIRQCIFIRMGKPCVFCTYEEEKILQLSIDSFVTSLEVILNEHRNINSLAIGGGTPNLVDMGASYFSELVEIARQLGLSVSVELVPPKNMNQLRLLADKGVSSIIMSLEVWNDKMRRQWCLGKGEITKSHYFKSWEKAIHLVGQGNVSSVLLVGTEPMDSTEEGARYLISNGIIPILIPLRRYTSSRFHDWESVDSTKYLALQSRIAKTLFDSGLDPSKQLGCVACGGCSLEVDLGKSKKQNIIHNQPL